MENLSKIDRKWDEGVTGKEINEEIDTKHAGRTR